MDLKRDNSIFPESLIIEKVTEISDVIDLDESNLTPIQEFYKDAKIFVTGVTGFLGQILVEKLLRSCPVSKIYVLVKEKKGKDVGTRLRELFDGVLYERLRRIDPNFSQKIIPIVGDCSLRNLGISDQDRIILIDEVDIIFHVAATVRFNEKLGRAAAINVRATRDLSIMAQQMPKLKSFVHVSTAYSNCIHDVIEERVYPAAKSCEDLLKLTESLDDFMMENLTPYFIGQYPNTYTYTKQIGEDVIKQETKGLPSGIYRPSIVVSTYKEPVKGWINNFYGFVGISYGAGTGVLRVMRVNSKKNANLVPADMCVYGLIASAWDVAQKFQKSKVQKEEYNLPVYHYESSNNNPITWKSVTTTGRIYGKSIPFKRTLWINFIYLYESYWVYKFVAFFFHTIPGAILDFILFCKGKKMRMLDLYKKIDSAIGAFSYFTTTSINFNSSNVQKMIDNTTERDREIFFCDLKELDWEEFFITYWGGIRMYLAKEPFHTIPEAKRRIRRFIWINRVLLGSSIMVILWLVISTINGLM